MQPINVLIVDYDKMYGSTIMQCLELQGGLAVESAFSADEAVEKSKKLNPAVIVVCIPPENQFFTKTAESLKQAGYDQPLIAFAIDVRAQLRRCRIKVDGYVEKYGDPAAVYAELKQVIINLTKDLAESILEFEIA